MFHLCIKATAKLCASGYLALEGAPLLNLHRGRIRSGPGDKPGWSRSVKVCMKALPLLSV